jgi:hypothetical protein
VGVVNSTKKLWVDGRYVSSDPARKTLSQRIPAHTHQPWALGNEMAVLANARWLVVESPVNQGTLPFEADLGVLTNVGPDHLETHGPFLDDLEQNKLNCILTGPDTKLIKGPPCEMGVDYRKTNYALAMRVREWMGVEPTVPAPQIPGRLQSFWKKGNTYICDLMKNALGAWALRLYIESTCQKAHFVFTMRRGRHLGRIVDQLASVARSFTLVNSSDRDKWDKEDRRIVRRHALPDTLVRSADKVPARKGITVVCGRIIPEGIDDGPIIVRPDLYEDWS